MVFKVLNRVCNFTIKGFRFLTVKTCDERSIFAIPIFYFHDFRVKNYLILYAKQGKSGANSGVSCLKQGSEMNNFCLNKQGRGLIACEQALCLGKKIARKGSLLDQRPVHRLGFKGLGGSALPRLPLSAPRDQRTVHLIYKQANAFYRGVSLKKIWSLIYIEPETVIDVTQYT